MTSTNLYRDIALRTGGEIYIGVVGPVRTGKSTLIKKFMETLVLPNMEHPYDRERARDEMPQSAAGKTVMTTEPKFIPDEAVEVKMSGGERMCVRMIDCVGYLVDGALGASEEGGERMVHTPWAEEAMPFRQAAEIGTRKVITEHSTIGIVVTTDGTIGEIPRESYLDAENRVIRELKQMGKPFVILLNSADPASPEAIALGHRLEQMHGAPVALLNCLELSGEDIEGILGMVLNEFPIRQIEVRLPHWTSVLESDHPLMTALRQTVLICAEPLAKIGDLPSGFAHLREMEEVESVTVREIDMGMGSAVLDIAIRPQVYYRVISELAGVEVEDECALCALLRELSEIRGKYERVAQALDEVERTGYGIVTPTLDEMRLEEPEIIRQSGSYGVKLKASGPSIHMIRAGIETEINPIVGTEQQSEDLVKYLLKEFDDEPSKLWDSNLFGKTLRDLITEGLHAKLEHIPMDARGKLSDTLARIINEGSGGLICILL